MAKQELTCDTISKIEKRKRNELPGEYLKRIKELTQDIFTTNRYYYKGKPIEFNLDLNIYGMSQSFTHATTSKISRGSTKYRFNLEDDERLSKLHWIHEIFTECKNCKNLIEIKKPGNENKIFIVCKNRLYLIILQESKHRDSYHFITAFPITKTKYERLEAKKKTKSR